MSEIFAGVPESELSPLDLAEKRYHLASEAYENQVGAELFKTMDPALKENAELAIKNLRDNKQKAWVEWVCLKPYVSDEMKNHLRKTQT